MLKRCRARGGKRILLGWNRGLGDIALGLYAIVQRIRSVIPDAEIVFMTRENLRDGFSMLEGVKTLIAPEWKRGQPSDVKLELGKMGIDPKSFDLIIEKPSPTDWVRWQRGTVIPRLKWNPEHDGLWRKFDLPDGFTYIGVQPVAETNYGLWRNWPPERWDELFQRLEKFQRVKVLLFGVGGSPQFSHRNLIDLRGKTTLFELLSIIKNRCRHLILPDSGILSMTYYLDDSFPIQVLSLWSDPNQGVLKQAVPSPNPQLRHHPLIGKPRDLSSVSAEELVRRLFPARPLLKCLSYSEASVGSLERVGSILLAGGQGSRLGVRGPKGIFSVGGKSLFQWIAEKTPENIPLAVMTSPLNHGETVDFFSKRGNFGREVYFFQQEMLPYLDEQKSPLPFEGPDGNGSVFRSFARSGLADLFAKRGIDLVTIVPVDNPLSDPADPALIGHLRNSGADAVVKCVKRESSDESMGVLAEREGCVEIVEYIDRDPAINYNYSYIGMMAVALPFLRKMAEIDLPLHLVKKKIPGAEAMGWKRERFIFDAFSHGRATALCYPRVRCYAPLKNADSVRVAETVLASQENPLPG